jgi:F0F1-type ATP synthase epsilon subunit
MKIILIINDQIKYSFEKAQSLLIETQSSGQIQILENHTQAFFMLKKDSYIEIKINESQEKKFLIKSDDFIIEIEEGSLIKILGSEIEEIN